jgi:DNA-binding NarL/FixJ family response regulator
MPSEKDNLPNSRALPSSRASHGGWHSTIRVLIVDDHPLPRESLRSMVKDCDYMEVVGEASTGLEALEEVAVSRPDVVVMDINLPVMNGIEATERIKADFPDTAVIGLSVQREEDIIEQMRAAGISSYVTKGSSFDTLRQAIEEAASSHGRSRI